MTTSSEPNPVPEPGSLDAERATQAQIVDTAALWLDRHGDSPQGVMWTRPEQAPIRYRMMLDLLQLDRLRDPHAPTGRPEVLDFGCGLGHLYEFLEQHAAPEIHYTGLDVSAAHLELARRKHPDVDFIRLDVLAHDGPLPEFDYVLLNGVLTWKNEASHEQMWAYARRLLTRVFPMARRAIAFNVMTTHLDWERDDLFHLAFDEVAAFLRAELTPHFLLRQDYGLFDYTVYAFRDPVVVSDTP